MMLFDLIIRLEKRDVGSAVISSHSMSPKSPTWGRTRDSGFDIFRLTPIAKYLPVSSDGAHHLTENSNHAESRTMVAGFAINSG